MEYVYTSLVNFIRTNVTKGFKDIQRILIVAKNTYLEAIKNYFYVVLDTSLYAIYRDIRDVFEVETYQYIEQYIRN